MATRKQQGFGVLGVLVLVVVIGIVGFTGWFIYHKQNQKDTGQTSSETTTKPDSSKTVSPNVASAFTDGAYYDTTFSKVPKDLQQAIVARYQSFFKTDPNCVKDSAIVDADGKAYDVPLQYVAPDYATVPIGCGEGGSVDLYAKVDGVWHWLQTTQFAYGCDTLKQHNVPATLLTRNGQMPAMATCASDDVTLNYPSLTPVQ